MITFNYGKVMITKDYKTFRNLSVAFILIFQINCSETPETPFLASDQNIDSAQLAAAYALAGQIDGMKSLLVERNGVIVAEYYFDGDGPEDLHDVRSVTKSFSSALIGIAINKGYIENVDETLADYLGSVIENLDEERGAITIHQLLTMSCGLEWSEIGDYSEFNAWVTSPDQINYILAKPFVTPPGMVFNYSDGAAHLVSVVLEEASGMSAQEFSYEYLFKPLEIEPRPWLSDNRGYSYGGVGLFVSPRDMIKLGRLYLEDGKFKGQDVVPAEWIITSTQNHIHTNNAVPYGPNYGYFWWVTEVQSYHAYFANGYGGQFIFNLPDLNLVVVATCKWRNTGGQADTNWYNIISLIVNNIIPAVHE
jgi:CubicO group peptidase (beta-lactamase class C family)